MTKLLVFIMLSVGCVRADQIPKLYVQSVVAFGHTTPGLPGQPGTWTTEASGFLYGYLVQDDPDIQKRRYQVFLVTNRHVLAGHEKIEVRLDPVKPGAGPITATVQLKDEQGHPIWVSHPDPAVDISVAQIDPNALKPYGLESTFIPSDTSSLTKKQLDDNGYSAGDTIFVLGFPMGITGLDHNYVITRKGSIARISDFLAGSQETYLIDSLIFPGNSGGPVFSGLQDIVLQGSKPQLSVKLIGVVRAYVPYTDVGVSQQTGRARITFEENSGLAEVISIDRVNETIRAAKSTLPVNGPPAVKTGAPK